MATWFETDKKGLGQLLRKRGIAFGVIELVQNALDEKTTQVDITLDKIAGRRQRYRLTVKDDNPEGFKYLHHSFTLFAPSEKKDDPLKRGRFNLGEKLVLAMCEKAQIETTKGTVRFHEDDTRTVHPRLKTVQGSIFTGEIVLDEEEYERTVRKIDTIIVPRGVMMFYNGKLIIHRTPVKEFEVNLPTVIADAEGNLARTRRNTEVQVFQPFPGEEASIYEMGLPVVDTGDTFHVNVMQKVPLNMSRDNVTPGYLREVRAAVLNNCHSMLDEDQASETWVESAMEDKRIEGSAVQQVMTQRFGVDRAVYTPGEPESNSKALDAGASLIHGRSFSAAAWENIRKHDSMGTRSSAVAYPTPKPFHPDGKPLKTLPKEKWGEIEFEIVGYAKWLAHRLLGVKHLTVVIADDLGWNFGGAFGGTQLTINHRHSKYWKRGPALDAFLIHEFGHYYSENHLSDDYHRALCRLGARLAEMALEAPTAYRRGHD